MTLYATPGFAQTPLRAGGLTALPPVISGDNLVQNPGFESVSGNVPTGWTVLDGAWASDPTTVRPGSPPNTNRFSLRFGSASSSATQTVLLSKGVYDLSGWVKTENVGGGGAGVRLTLDLRPALDRWYVTDVIAGTRDWALYAVQSIVIESDNTMATITLENYAGATGTAWFDDIRLVQQVPPPVSAFMLYPNYRGMIFDDRTPRSMRFDVTVSAGAADPTPFTVTATVKDWHRRPVFVKTYPNAPRHFVVEVDAGYMLPLVREHPERVYAVTFSVNTTPAYAYPDFQVSLVPAAARRRMNVAFDEHNNVLIRGTPHFMLGVYDSSSAYSADASFWDRYLWSPTGERRLANLPISLYLNYIFGAMPADGTEALIRSLRDHGARYLQTANCGGGIPPDEFSANNSDAYVQAVDTSGGIGNGIAGFYAADECPPSFARDTFAQYQRLKSLAPDTMTFAALLPSDAPALPLWRDAVDVLATDPYPLYDTEPPLGYPHSQVADAAALTRKAVAGARPFFVVLQFFRTTEHSRWPTLAEMRSHAYMSIVEGAKGLFWWSLGNQYFEGTDLGGWCPWDDQGTCDKIPTRTQLMAQLEQVVNELAGTLPGADPDLPDVLVAKDAPAALTATSNPAIRTKVKLFGGKGYVFAYNHQGKTAANPSGDQTVTFTWNTAPGTIIVNAEIANGQRRTITPSGSSFTDTFGPYEAHVYVIPHGGSAGTPSSASK
ncbi:MAG TPA: hypothetical protein VFJ24_03475 [Gaiellales bacterium]|nr:hypothetical protein [Gaiellales bacterium]